jgi:hypothetical protein
VDLLAFMQPETTNSLAAIKTLGFDGALRAALTRAMAHPDAKAEALRCLKLARSYLKDARAFNFSPGLHSRYLLLASFYRILAHRIYWKAGFRTEQARHGFLRVIK